MGKRHYLDMKKQIAYVNEDAIVYIGENSYSGKAEIYVSGDEEDGLISIEASLSLPRILVAVERKFASDHRSGSSGVVGSRKALRVPAGSWSSEKAYRPWSSMCSQISGVSR